MAIRAAAIEQPDIGQGTVREISSGKQLRGMAVLSVTALAQYRTRGDQELLVVGAVRRMAIKTTVPHGRVLEEEGSALLGMTGKADFIHAVGLHQRLGRAAVRIMAVDPGHLVFQERHVRSPRELRA